MTVRLSWTTVLALSVIVVLGALLVAHTIGFYLQLLVFALALVALLAFMGRRSYRRAAASWRSRRPPPGPRV
jgi:hypothetical protein